MEQKIEELKLSGFTCDKCGKIFLTKEEFDNRHKKVKKD